MISRTRTLRLRNGASDRAMTSDSGSGAAQARRRGGRACRERDMGTADGLRGSTIFVAYRLRALPDLR